MQRLRPVGHSEFRCQRDALTRAIRTGNYRTAEHRCEIAACGEVGKVVGCSGGAGHRAGATIATRALFNGNHKRGSGMDSDFFALSFLCSNPFPL